MRGVGHQHAVAASEAEVCRQCRALVAALFLDDLDQQHLAAADDLLDLIAAAQRLALAAHDVGVAVGPAADLGDFLAVLALVRLVRFGLGKRGLFAEQRLTVLAGDLVIIGVDFGEREKAVAVTAIFDERRL